MDEELIFHEQYEGLVLCLLKKNNKQNKPNKKNPNTTQTPHLSKLTKRARDFLLKQITKEKNHYTIWSYFTVRVNTVNSTE